jgi:hypothetical protein
MDGQLQELHIQCVRALKEYMGEANKTCDLLAALTEFPVSDSQVREITDQRVVENAAYARYQFARQNLFIAANWDSG